MLKKIIVVLTALLGLVSLNAFAVPGATQDILLSTDVAVDCTVETSAASFTPNLVVGESGTTVATITEVCNDMDGYTVTFTSANGGFLQNSDVAGEQKDYSISYGNDISDKKLNTGRTESYTVGTASNAVALLLHLDANVGVLAAGTWSDTITATVAAL